MASKKKNEAAAVDEATAAAAGVGAGETLGALDTLLYLDPENITEPETTNVRPFSTAHGDTEDEIQAIEQLMRSIEVNGQLQAVKVMLLEPATETSVAKYALIAGRRRRRAVQMHNMAAGADQQLRLLAVVHEGGLKAGKQFQQAAHENLQRAGISPMDFALDIRIVRKNSKWEGAEGTKKVAEFFGVSPAQVTEHEKLLSLPEDVQVRVHSGELSKDDAFKLARIAEKSGGEVASAVAERALEAAREVEAGEIVDADPLGVESDAAPTTDAAPDAKKGKGKKAKAAKKAGAAAKSKVIREAVRNADPNKPQARSRKEILEFFQSCLGPVYGHPNGAVHMFVDALLGFAQGVVTEKKLYAAFDRAVEGADKGTVVASKAETKPEPSKRPAPASKPVSKPAPKSTPAAKKGGGKGKSSSKK